MRNNIVQNERGRFENDEVLSIIYNLNTTVQTKNIRDIIDFFETDTVTMAIFHCDTFNENDNCMYRCYHAKEELEKLETLPSPYMSFSIDFANTKTRQYVFSISTGINLRYVKYIVNKKKLSSTLDLPFYPK